MIFLQYLLCYLVFSTILAVYVYYSTLKEYKFKASAKEFGLAMYFWPLLLILFTYVYIAVRVKEYFIK